MSSKRIEAFALLTLLLLMVLACISETTMAENPPLPEGAARVVVETSLGNFIIGLHEEQSPVTVTNFLSYVNTQHFDRTVFHRVHDSGWRVCSSRQPVCTQRGSSTDHLGIE